MTSAKRHFKVTVNGKEYDVVVEELPAEGSGAIGALPVSRPPKLAAPPPPRPLAPQAAPGTVAAPMAGKVLRVPVEVGQAVEAGDPLVVLDAMKMETNVNASLPGTVAEIFVKEGDTVEAGAALVRVA